MGKRTDDKVARLGQRNSHAWTPLEALKALVADIEAGKVGNIECLAVHFMVRCENGRLATCYQLANMTYERHIALCELVLHDTIEDWRTA